MLEDCNLQQQLQQQKCDKMLEDCNLQQQLQQQKCDKMLENYNLWSSFFTALEQVLWQ
jgi:hypothetical protein